jgi:site-specific DNA recombinase
MRRGNARSSIAVHVPGPSRKSSSSASSNPTPSNPNKAANPKRTRLASAFRGRHRPPYRRTSKDRDLVRTRLNKAVVYRNRMEITLQQDDDSDAGAASSLSTISIHFAATLPLRKGVSHAPTRRSAMNDALRISLLTAIAKSRNWLETIINDPAVDFGVLANREKLAERHVRFLAPLAYLSPLIIQAIAEGRAPADLTVTRLARNLPLSWAKQEEQLGIV